MGLPQGFLEGVGDVVRASAAIESNLRKLAYAFAHAHSEGVTGRSSYVSSSDTAGNLRQAVEDGLKEVGLPEPEFTDAKDMLDRITTALELRHEIVHGEWDTFGMAGEEDPDEPWVYIIRYPPAHRRKKIQPTGRYWTSSDVSHLASRLDDLSRELLELERDLAEEYGIAPAQWRNFGHDSSRAIDLL